MIRLLFEHANPPLPVHLEQRQRGDQGGGVERVDEVGQDQPVEVGGQEGAEGGEEDHDGDGHGQVEPLVGWGEKSGGFLRDGIATTSSG